MTDMTPDLVDALDEVLRRTARLRGRAYTAAALHGGTTNRNIHVTLAPDSESPTGEEWVVRFAGKNTHLLGIDRHVELAANTNAAAIGLAPEVIAFVQPQNYLVTRFLSADPISITAVREPDNLAAIANAMRMFHASPALDAKFGSFTIGEKYRATAAAHGVTVPSAYQAAAAHVREIRAAIEVSGEPLVPCHNDLLNANFLVDAHQRVWLIDWEYAGMNHRWFDLGNFAVNHEFNADERDALIEHYFGAITPQRRARVALFMIVSDMREAMWNVVQQAISTLDIDFAAAAAELFERLLSACGSPEYQRWLRLAAEPDE